MGLNRRLFKLLMFFFSRFKRLPGLGRSRQSLFPKVLPRECHKSSAAYLKEWRFIDKFMPMFRVTPCSGTHRRDPRHATLTHNCTVQCVTCTKWIETEFSILLSSARAFFLQRPKQVHIPQSLSFSLSLTKCKQSRRFFPYLPRESFG